jgi:hypothetical protein
MVDSCTIVIVVASPLFFIVAYTNFEIIDSKNWFLIKFYQYFAPVMQFS